MSLQPPFGGCYVPESLCGPIQEVKSAFDEAITLSSFIEEERTLFTQRIGRPTAITCLERLSDDVGGARIWAKREDLSQSGSFLAASAFSQTLLAKWMGKKEVHGESATGDFGVALASAGAALGMRVRVFMKRDDQESVSFNINRIRKLGGEVLPAEGNLSGRRQAFAEALRYFATHHETSFYATSSLASPAPYPAMLQRALRLIGAEARQQLQAEGVQPEYVVAPIGSGSFGVGLFDAFIDEDTQLVGVQAGGEEGGLRGADSLVRGKPGIFMGTHSLVLQDEDGQIESTHTRCPGLAMPVAGYQHAHWLQEGRIHYVTVDDERAAKARRVLVRKEGIFASLESGYSLAYALNLAATGSPSEAILVGITGGGVGELGNDQVQEGED